MAGRKLKFSSRVEASTILEVVISMIVIILVFGIAMMIFGNVSRLSLSAKKLKAQAILQGKMLNIEQTPVSQDGTEIIGDFQVDQEIKPYGDDKQLLQINLTAYDGNHQKVAELKKVIIAL